MAKNKALILARGGSKGIPRKNIMPLLGKPLISYSIEAAKQSNVDEVWVSTDCEEIKIVAKMYGAYVIDRPEEISTDTSKSEEALLHFAENNDFDNLVFIQPTSPLIKPEYINQAIEMLNEYDSVFSCYEEHWVPRWTKDIKEVDWKKEARPMRQEKQSLLVECGMFYLTTKEALLKSKLRYSGKIGVVLIPIYHSFQIDVENDIILIEKIMRS